MNLGVRYNVVVQKLFSESRAINALRIIDSRWAFASDDDDSGYFETNYSIDGQNV